MDIFQKDFDKWIEKKKSLHFKVVIPPLFKERDIWWIKGVSKFFVLPFPPKREGRGLRQFDRLYVRIL